MTLQIELEEKTAACLLANRYNRQSLAKCVEYLCEHEAATYAVMFGKEAAEKAVEKFRAHQLKIANQSSK
jgi:hypothetical protein